MKSLVNIFYFSILILGASKCSNSQELVESPPFKTGDVVSEDWVSAEGEKGTNLFVPITEGKDIELDSVYFRGNIVKLEKIKRDSYLVFIGKFEDAPQSERDFVMHADPKKEVGNIPPLPKRKLPFELKDNEAIVSFVEDGKEKYFKIENIKESPTVKN